MMQDMKKMKKFSFAKERHSNPVFSIKEEDNEMVMDNISKKKKSKEFKELPSELENFE